MIKYIKNYAKYEDYIRIGHTATESVGENNERIYTCTDLEDFPTPSSMSPTYHDVDLDPFTDLEGYTSRNRVRSDVNDYELGWNYLSDDDLAYILTRIKPQWIYVELIDKHKRDDVTDTNGYIKYINNNQNDTYWYDKNNNVLYDNNYNVISNFDLINYTKITKPIKKVHKMYASDKSFDTTFAWIDEDNNWHEEHQALSFSLVEE